MSKWGTFFSVLKKFGPQILKLTPLAPIAEEVEAAIADAEQIPGATSTEKLNHVVNIAAESAQAVNDKAGHEVLKVEEVRQSGGAIVSGVVNSVNHIKAIHVPAPAEQPAV